MNLTSPFRTKLIIIKKNKPMLFLQRLNKKRFSYYCMFPKRKGREICRDERRWWWGGGGVTSVTLNFLNLLSFGATSFSRLFNFPQNSFSTSFKQTQTFQYRDFFVSTCFNFYDLICEICTS